MSQTDKVTKWMQVASILFSAQILGIIGMGVTDHFRLAELQADVAVMKPRVEVLWYADATVKRAEPVIPGQ